MTEIALHPQKGRHRRPRPRKVLFVAGGLALAAGALSLVRLVPDSGVGGPGSAEAEPHMPGQGGGEDRSANAGGTVSAGPLVSPSSTSVMGGASALPTATTGPTGATGFPPATPPTTLPSALPGSGATTIPEAPGTPAHTTAPRPPGTTVPAPRPTPAEPRATSTPSPAPPKGQPGLCVPVICLCVGPLLNRPHG